MKRCPYCGAEYPDDFSVCSIDSNPLPEIIKLPPPADERIAATNTEPTYLTFPDYQWSARDAWKCLGMYLFFEFVLGLFFWMMDFRFPGFYSWRRSGFGYCSTSFLYYAVNLLTAAYFARTETLSTFLKAFGLDRKPSDYVWFGVTMAIAINLFGYFMLYHAWGKGVTNYDTLAFKSTFGPERYFFLVPLLLFAPLIEESINRGFLYKAFRGSFATGISMALIVGWTAYTHWSQYHQSLLAAFDLSVLTIVQCYLREKSDSLWDCILCHLAFNGSGLLIYQVLR
jgi:membrane protease YdiL (CAAX protease family)